MSGQKSLQPPDLQTYKMADHTEQFLSLLHHQDECVKCKVCAIKNTLAMFCIRITSRNKLQELNFLFFH